MFIKTAPPAEAEEQGPESEVTLGAFLKAARLSQGLDLAAVANETRINYKNLIALEDDNRARLPADVFSRGFVRLYATYLKLDPQEAIRLYEKQWGVNGSFVGRPLIAKKIPSLPARPGIFITLLVIALFFGVRIYYPEVPCPSGGGEGGGPNSQGTIGSPGKGGSEAVSPAPQAVVDQQQAAATPGLTSGTKGAAETGRAVIGQAETSTTDKVEPSPLPVGPPPAYEISLHTAHQITVKLSIDGQEPVEKMLPSGNRQTWSAAKGFVMTLDRTDGVELTVNGAQVPIKTEAGQTVTIERP